MRLNSKHTRNTTKKTNKQQTCTSNRETQITPVTKQLTFDTRDCCG